MSSFKSIKQQYQDQQLTKGAFVEAMYGIHQHLFDYVGNFADCNIASIKLDAHEVVATFRDPAVSMVCVPEDVRIAPIEAFNFGDYEHDEIQVVRRIVKLLGGASVSCFDIGANAGFYSLALAHYFPGIQGQAFEPVPKTFQVLTRNFAINQMSGIQANNLGLSKEDSELIFYTYPSQSGASSMTRNVEDAACEEVRCKVVRLDDFTNRRNLRVDFIKCDVEGAELFVFQGGAETLRRDKPVVFSEMLRKWCAKYSYHPNEIIALFKDLGYECYVVTGDRLKSCPTITEQTVETNFLFLANDKHQALKAALVS